MKFRQIIREYFSFSKGERVGIAILIMLMTIILIADRLIFYFEKPAVADKERFDKLIAEFEKQQEEAMEPVSLFFFDPNTIDSAAMDSLALPPRIRRNLLAYRSHGGTFKTREDLRKIYGMNDSIYAMIGHYIEIKKTQTVQHADLPETEIRPKKQGEEIRKQETTAFVAKTEINRATAEELMKLYGIGPVLSERIIKYRNLLGGFYSPEQIKEVYGLTPETWTGIEGHLDVDTTAVVLININFAGKGDLSGHPYLGWKGANSIVRYREKTGFIEDRYQLLRDSVLDADTFKKISPYLQTIRD